MGRLLLLVLVAARLVSGQDPLQKNMLTADIGWGTRYALPDRTWPENPGEADVCLWADDKTAAVSIGVDDNIQPDHAWWLEMGQKYGFRFTWWIVTYNEGPDKEGEPGFNPFFGTWDDFRLLYAEGHEMGSHSVNHPCIDTTDEFWDDELRLSKESIEMAIPGYRVKSYAAPCGKQPSAETIAKYYISCRGVNGGTNGANKTRYYQTVVNSSFSPACLLDPVSTSWPCAYRGWQVIFYHYLQGNNAEVESTVMQPLYACRDSIWVGRYGDVAMYGQSRDTHTLTVDGVTDSMIVFTLTDSMNDTLYTYPLTVKVRLNNDWDTCIATQNGESVEATVLEHEGDKYAFVKAVPDRGQVVLSTQEQITDIRRFPVTGRQLPDGKRQRIFSLSGEEIPSEKRLSPGLYMMYNGMTLVKKMVVR